MVDFKSSLSEVQRMASAKMSFGRYEAASKNMVKKYNASEPNTMSDDFMGTSIKSTVTSYEQNGKSVACSFLDDNGTEVSYAIYDNNTKRTYSSGWQTKDNASDRFNYIAFGGYYLEDSNNNGYVDKNDKVYLNDASGVYMFVKDILSGNFRKIFNQTDDK